MHGHGSDWTEERVERLKQLYAEGCSASTIAGELGGITRNAVIGKVHRLGLTGRAPRQSPAEQAGRLVRAKARAVGAGNGERRRQKPQCIGAMRALPVSAPVAIVEARSVDVVDRDIPIERRQTILTVRDGQCKWPHGDPRDENFFLCGARTDGGPFCGHHARVAYEPAQPARIRGYRGLRFGRVIMNTTGCISPAERQGELP